MSRAQLTSTVEQNTGGAVAPFVAGKNVLINGSMDWWQRGVSFAVTPANFAYMSDRWYWIGATASVAQETTIVPTNFRYSLKATATGTTQPVFGQTVETANCYQLAGQTVTLSAWVATSDSSAVTLRLDYSIAVDNPSNGSWTTITSTSGSNNVSATSTMTRKSLSFVIPSTALTLRVLIYTSGNVSTGTTLTMTGAQLELGTVPTPFSRAGGTLSGELAACQRYYWRTLGTAAYGIFSFGMGTGSTSGIFPVNFPTTMRTAPTIIDYSNLQWNDTTNGAAISALTIDNANPQMAKLNGTTSSGITNLRPTMLLANGSSTAYLGLGAEL